MRLQDELVNKNKNPIARIHIRITRPSSHGRWARCIIVKSADADIYMSVGCGHDH